LTARGRAALVTLAVVLYGGSLSVATTAPSVLGRPQALPPGTAELDARALQALADFQRDPVANGPALVALTDGPLEGLPLVLLLGAADASLRAGRFRKAQGLFGETLRRRPGAPWETFAELGLGWTLLVSGSTTAAERHYARVATDGPLGAIAQVMMGWLAALRGDYAAAITTLDHWSEVAGVSGPVQRVALLGAAYARYWAGDYVAAADTFDLLQPGGAFSVLADDARYAAAWSRVRAGDLARAVADLVALAEAGVEDARAHVSRARLKLTPRAVLRAGRENAARISGLATLEDRMTSFFDGDGHALARAALVELVGTGAVEPESVPARFRAAPIVPVARAQAVDTTLPRPARAESTARTTSWTPVLWTALAIALALLLIRRRQPSATRR
jgi:hypothetical protein